MKGHQVVALAYDGLCAFEFGCVVEMFGLERPELGVDWYDFRVCAAEPGPLRSAAGISLQVPHGLEALEEADTIVIPGWRGVDVPVPEALAAALVRAHARGARIATICSGAFVLAAAGLLDGRRATTHWLYAEALRAAFPAIRVEPDVLYVEDGRLITSAGSAAGLDMLLHLVRSDHGPTIANIIARRLVIPPHRHGGQAQFVERPVPPVRDARFVEVIDHVRANLAHDHSTRDLARRAAMSERTFFRRFRETVGLSPADWIIAERVAAAKDLLETSRLSVEQIALHCGFGAPETLRHHFRRLVGRSPADYRRSFARSLAA